MNLSEYLERAGLGAAIAGDDLAQADATVTELLKDARARSVPATPRALNGLYQYRVPKTAPDGSCSLPDQLEAAPYDLTAILGGRVAFNTMSLLAVDSMVDLVSTQLAVGWLGAYQARAGAGGQVLVKLASRGVPSRAEYPLTADFAKGSNNVAVARSGKARVIQDVAAHVAKGGAYYQCDAKVKSEACLPVLRDGKVLGVVDAEHSESGYFIERRLAWLVALAFHLPGVLPPNGLALDAR